MTAGRVVPTAFFWIYGGNFRAKIEKLVVHSALRRNLMKVWKTWTGPSLGGRAWSRGLKSALSKILQNKEHFH